MNITKKIINQIKKFYIWLGIPFSPEGTLPYSIHKICKKIYNKKFIKQKKERKKRTFTVAFWSGIGDSLWSIVLLPALLNKYNIDKVDLIVHSESKDIRNGRANDFLERFIFFNSIRNEHFNIRKYPIIDTQGYPCYVESGEKVGDIFDYLLLANTFLEHGKNFKEIAQILSLDETLLDYSPFDNYHWEFEDFKEVHRILEISPDGYCIFYMCSLTDNTIAGLNRGGLWKIDDWLELGRKIYKNVGIKIVIVGASYDLDYFKKLQQYSDKSFHDIFINNCGTLSLTETLGLLKYAHFVIGLPSGIPISSVYLRTKTAMFWRPQELSMHDMHEKYGFHPDFSVDWVPHDMLTSKNYIPFWYGKDNATSVFNKISSEKWLDTKRDIDINQFIFKQNIKEINIEISNYCNRKCPYCPNSLFPVQKYNEIDTKSLKNLLSDLKFINYKEKISLNLFNEPLYNTNSLFSIISLIHKNIPDSKILIFTNGDFLDEKIFNKLVGNVSCISVTAHYSNEYNNKKQKKSILNILKKINVSNIDIIEGTASIHSEFTKSGTIINIQSKNFKSIGQDRGGLVSNFTNSSIRGAPCSMPKWQININFDGEVYPCCNIYPRKINNDVFLGSIHEKSIFDIYGSEKYQNFVYKVQHCEFTEKCKTCSDKR